jgi:hypothetical protein
MNGSWSPGAVWAMLRNERYRGIIVWGRALRWATGQP